MKKQFRFLTALVMLVVFTAVFAMPAAAQESGSAEGEWCTPSYDVLKTIYEIEEKSLTSGVVTVAQGETHCAVLFADGTVTAFQSSAFFGCRDFGECDVSDWSGIQEIACRAECTFGLKQDGSIVWAGNPEIGGFDYGTESLDDGWKKISEGKNYTAIATQPYMPLFALNSDGTVDCAFLTSPYDGVKELTNIIDIACGRLYGYPYFAALASDGTVSLFSWSPVLDGELLTLACEGAQKLCVHEGRFCAVMKNGDVQYLAFDPAMEYEIALNAEIMDKLQPRGTVSEIWIADSNSGSIGLQTRIIRMDGGNVYWTQTFYTYSGPVHVIKETWDLQNLRDAYVTSLALQTTANGESQKLEIILAVMEDGTLYANYSIPMPQL